MVEIYIYTIYICGNDLATLSEIVLETVDGLAMT